MHTTLSWGGHTWHDVDFQRAEYMDGSLAIRATSDEGEGYGPEPLTTVTVSLAQYGEYPNEGCIFVKDYNENEGLGDVLVAEGYLERTDREVVLPHGSIVREYKLVGDWSDWTGTDQGRITGWGH